MYLIRHQKGGFWTGHVFAAEPTGEQLAVVARYMDAIHGAGWVMSVPVDVCGAELPTMPATPQERTATLAFGASGTARVL